MTGREFLERLQSLSDIDLEKEIAMEGCDCYGECTNLSIADTIDLNRY